MSGLSVVDPGPDLARLRGRVIISGSLAVQEQGSDTVGSTLMQQIAAALAPLAKGGAWIGRAVIEPLVFPYVVFFRVIRSNEITFDGPTDMQGTRVQIDSLSDRYAEADDLGRRIRAVMLERFVIGAIDEQDFPPDDQANIYRVSADYTIWSVD